MVVSLINFQLPSRMEASDVVGVGEQLAVRYLAVTSPGTALAGNGVSTTGNSDSPVSRFNTNTASWIGFALRSSRRSRSAVVFQRA